MTQVSTFTQNDVIRYAYNELSDSENSLMEDAMVYDNTLLDFYLDCIDLKTAMNKITLSPSNRVMENVMNYSRNYKANV